MYLFIFNARETILNKFNMMFMPLFVMISASFAFSEMGLQGKTCDICNCSVNAVVDCSFRDLSHIPTDISVNTSVLNLSSNHINSLGNRPFEKLRNLLVLDLYNNSLKIQSVSNLTFSGLSKLKLLNIAHNDQLPLTNETTPIKFFETMPSLEVLKMYGTTGTYNIKHEYPDVALSKLPSLKELWIDGLTNMSFGLAFRNMTKLKVLRIAGDYVEPSWRSNDFCNTDLVKGMLDNLATISHLYIRKCNIETVDVNTFQNLHDLEYLDLSENPALTLKRISTAFGSLQNKTNTLVLNEIESFKPNTHTVVMTAGMVESLRYLPLRELHLDKNRIELIEPDVFNKLPKTLQIISAKQNQFFPGYYIFSVRYLENLKHLDLSQQFFTSNLAVWHQSRKDGITADSDYLTVNTKSNFDKSELINHTHVTHTEDSHTLETGSDKYLVTDSYRYDNDADEYEGTGADSYHHTKSTSSTKKPEKSGHKITGNISRHAILQYMPLTFTCPHPSNEFYIPPGTVVGYIPPKLEYLDISVSKLASPVFQFIFSTNNSLKILNASRSLLYCLEGPIRGFQKLEHLDLSENYSYNISRNFFKYANSLKSLYIHKNCLGSIFGKDYTGEIMQPLTKLETLNISYNRLYGIPKRFFTSQRNLVSLSAYGNVLEKFGANIGHMGRLRNLDLSLNYITTLSDATRGDLETISSQIDRNSHGHLKVNLRRNPIHCYCYNIEFLKWVFKHSDPDSALVVEISECLFHENQTRVKIYSHEHLKSTIDHLEKQCRSYVGLIVGLTVFLVVVINIILGVIVHKHRWQLQYWYYVVLDNYRCKVKLCKTDYEEFGDTYPYDIFVASVAEDVDGEDNLDNDFVIDKLRPFFKSIDMIAFLQVYHIQGGGNLIQTIGRAINSSRVVLFVFSDGWSKDDSMKIAVHMWQCDMMQRHCPNSVFGITLNEMTGEDLEMMHDIHCRTIMDFPRGHNERTTFWREFKDKLRDLRQMNSSNVANSTL